MANERQYGQRIAYEIAVKGSLGQEWSAWFDGFEITPLENGETFMVGQVPDQPALHGLLAKILDLGLTLIRLERKM